MEIESKRTELSCTENVGPSDKMSAMTKITLKEAICQTLNASPSFKAHIAKSKVHGRHYFLDVFEQHHFGQKESSMLNGSHFSSCPFFGRRKKISPIPPLSKLSFAPLTIKLQPWRITLHPNSGSCRFQRVSGFTGPFCFATQWSKWKPTRLTRTPDVKWHAKIRPGKRCRQWQGRS